MIKESNKYFRKLLNIKERKEEEKDALYFRFIRRKSNARST